jgi:hypothetical protein
VTTGLVIVLWLCGLMRGRVTLIIVPVVTAMLLLTHTRTALIAMMAGVVVGGLSLFVARARVRKLFVAGGVLVSIGAITLSSVVTTWLARGESGAQLATLTNRTTVWTAVLNVPRNWFQVLFGFGLSNQGLNGLSIDSNWYAAYYDQGVFAVVVCATILLFLFVTAYFQPARRAACPRAVPRDVLPGGVVHRDRVQPAIDVPPRAHPGRVAAGAVGRGSRRVRGSKPMRVSPGVFLLESLSCFLGGREPKNASGHYRPGKSA